MIRSPVPAEFDAFQRGDLEFAVSNAHHAYSSVYLKEYPACHVAVIGDESPIQFSEMVQYFTQADPFEQFLVDAGLERTGRPLTWFYHNDRSEPADPGGNPVRAPFGFEVGYEIREPASPKSIESETVGRYFTRALRQLRVASVFYRGSFPHQEHSAFADAGMTLVDRAPVMGYELSMELYREIYHHLDYSDPSRSVTEIQVELRAGGTGTT